MGDVNKLILVGRLGADPTRIVTQAGTVISQFPIATSRRYRSSSGASETIENHDAASDRSSWVHETQWHRVVVWGRQAEACHRYLHKGDSVYVEGYLKTRRYEDKENSVTRSFVEVHADIVNFFGKGSMKARENVKEEEPISTV